MIAPLRTDRPISDTARRAARLRAAAFLPAEKSPITQPQVPAWQAWVLAGWVTGTAAVYVALLARRYFHL